jgi:hypothetical protein
VPGRIDQMRYFIQNQETAVEEALAGLLSFTDVGADIDFGAPAKDFLKRITSLSLTILPPTPALAP